MNLRNSEQQYTFAVDNKQGLMKANDSNYVFISKDQGSKEIEVMNLITGEKVQTTLPESKDYFMGFYLIGENNDKGIYAHRKDGIENIVEIGIASLGAAGSCQVLREFSDCRYLKFLLVNDERKLLLMGV